MKNSSFILFVLLSYFGCKSQKKDIIDSKKETTPVVIVKQYNIPKFVYEANTRGFYEKIIIEDKIVLVYNDRSGKTSEKPIQLSDDENKELSSFMKAIRLDALATYKDPTQKRFYDGAAIANLTISTNGIEYKTVDFDHGNPPIEIEKIVNKITSFGTKK
jgi:hypothetical protein